ncbi:amidohydrolase family protein [Maricaulis sp. CAU 1757]
MRLLVLACLVSLAGCTTAPDPYSLAITGVTVIDGTGAEPIPDAVILIRGETIVAVGPATGMAPYQAEQILDRPGRHVMPGLVNSHVHLMMRGLGSNEAALQAELDRMLAGGVTTVRDMAGDARLLQPLQAQLARGDRFGPDVYYSAILAGPDFIALDPRVGRASAPMERGTADYMQLVTADNAPEEVAARAAASGASGVKFYVGVDAPVISAVTEAVHGQGLQAWAHSAVFPDRPLAIARSGVDSMSHLCWLAWQDADLDPASNVPYTHQRPPADPRPRFEAGLVAADSPEMRQLYAAMAEADILLDATYLPYVITGGGGGCTAELMTEIAREASAAGIAFSTGTDFFLPPDETVPSVVREIELLVEADILSPAEALVAATRNGARSVGLEDEFGTIAPGLRANLIILTADPLANIAALRQVETVIKRGAIQARP